MCTLYDDFDGYELVYMYHAVMYMIVYLGETFMFTTAKELILVER